MVLFNMVVLLAVKAGEKYSPPLGNALPLTGWLLEKKLCSLPDFQKGIGGGHLEICQGLSIPFEKIVQSIHIKDLSATYGLLQKPAMGL